MMTEPTQVDALKNVFARAGDWGHLPFDRRRRPFVSSEKERFLEGVLWAIGGETPRHALAWSEGLANESRIRAAVLLKQGLLNVAYMPGTDSMDAELLPWKSLTSVRSPSLQLAHSDEGAPTWLEVESVAFALSFTGGNSVVVPALPFKYDGDVLRGFWRACVDGINHV